jgi:hypothetical protein
MGALHRAIALTALAMAVLDRGSARAGETRCWLDQGAVVAAAAFGDVAGDFIIDLSRPVSALHVTRANLDGVDADAVEGPLEFAGQRIAALKLPVVDLDPQTHAFDTSINGIIGWDVLGRYAVTLDLRRGGCRFALSPRRGRPTRTGRGLAMVAVSGAPAFRAAIADSRTSRSGLFWIYTGGMESRIAGAGLAGPIPAGGAPVRLRAVSIAGVLFEEVPALPDPSVGPAAGAIGTTIWRGALIRIDPARQEMRVEFPPDGRQWPTLRQIDR